MQAALAVADRATPVEQALIRALPARYPQREPIEDQRPWDKAFTGEMRKVFAAFPGDLDVALRLRRGDHERDAVADVGPRRPAASPRTPAPRRRSALLEGLFADMPASWDHPGLLHLYVHLMEMSPFPQRALSGRRPAARAGARLRAT